MKPLPATAYALYRPDGTPVCVYPGGTMDPERKESILAMAWEEIRPPDYHRSGTPIPHAVNEAWRLGYRVVAVIITPAE